MINITFIKGQHPWNYGLTKETDLRVKKNSDLLKRIEKSKTWRDNLSKAEIGKHNSQETEFKKGQSSVNRPKLSDGSWYPPIFDLCHCLKCNEIVYGGKKYITGHQIRVYKPTSNIDICIRISKTMRGRILSEEHCKIYQMQQLVKRVILMERKKNWLMLGKED